MNNNGEPAVAHWGPRIFVATFSVGFAIILWLARWQPPVEAIGGILSTAILVVALWRLSNNESWQSRSMRRARVGLLCFLSAATVDTVLVALHLMTSEIRPIVIVGRQVEFVVYLAATVLILMPTRTDEGGAGTRLRKATAPGVAGNER